MKKWAVNIPVLIREAGEHPDRDTHEYAMSVRFEVEAETAPQAAHLVWERLEPTVGDP